jgi:peptidoglycan/LPS O-acetylase OafA/YrhL
MSGYVLTKKYLDTNDSGLLRSGAAKRYPRLAIPAGASMIFAYVLQRTGLMFTQFAPEIGSAGWPMDAYKATVGLDEVLREFLSLPFAGSVPINAPLWTIMLELIGSFLMFAAYALFGRRRPVATTILFAVLSMLVFRGLFVQLHLLTIFAGSLLHYIMRHLRGISGLPVVMVLAGIVGGAYDFSPWFDWLRIPMPTLPVPMPDLAGKEREVFNAIGAILLVAGVLGSNAIARALSCQPLTYLGKISFSLYLIHWPIICSVSFGTMYLLKVRNGIDYLAALGATAMVTAVVVLAAAHLFEKLVDRPAIHLADLFSTYILYGHRADRPPPLRHRAW